MLLSPTSVDSGDKRILLPNLWIRMAGFLSEGAGVKEEIFSSVEKILI